MRRPQEAPVTDTERRALIARDIVMDWFLETGLELEDTREEPSFAATGDAMVTVRMLVPSGIWVTARVLVPAALIEERSAIKR